MGYWTDLSHVNKCRILSDNIRSIANQCNDKLEISDSNYKAPEKLYLTAAINQVYSELLKISSDLDALSNTILEVAKQREAERQKREEGENYCKS